MVGIPTNLPYYSPTQSINLLYSIEFNSSRQTQQVRDALGSLKLNQIELFSVFCGRCRNKYLIASKSNRCDRVWYELLPKLFPS